MGLVERVSERARNSQPGASKRGMLGWPQGTYPSDGSIPPNSAMGGVTRAGVVVTETTALQHEAVYGSVSLIADTIGLLPKGVFRDDADGHKEPVRPTPMLVAEPYPGMTPFDWWHQVMTSLLLRGNAYMFTGADIDTDFRPKWLYPLHPDIVGVRLDRDTGKPIYRVGSKEYGDLHIKHVRGFTLPGCPVGLSPIEYHAQKIGVGLAASKFGADWFGEGIHPSSVLETDEHLEKEESDEVMSDWVNSHAGSRRPALLSGGLKHRAITPSPAESQFLETQGYSGGVISGMIYRVPPHMLGMTEKSTSWGSGIEEQGLGYTTFTVGPWIKRWEDAFFGWLPKPRYMRMNVAGLMRARTLDRFQAYTLARAGGWMCVDDIRALEELPPLPDGLGQEFNQPLNWGPLGFDPMKKDGGPNQ